MADEDQRFAANRTVSDLLVDPEVRDAYRSFHTFFGEREFGRLVVFLRGYDAALIDFIPEKSLFDGFQEWMVMHHGLDASTPWDYFIIERYGDGVDATPKFFEVWDRFRAERDEKGIRQLLNEFKAYDIKRFGMPTYYRERPYLT